jgi:hypothetical protein
MWKLALGFALFAAVAIFVLMQGGDIDMSGEKHDVGAAAEPAASTAAVADAASAPASAASQ